MEIALSKMAAGCMLWGEGGIKANTQEMQSLMHAFMDVEISTFDHADIYGDYTTEEAFGRAFAQSNIAREDITLITKCGIRKPNNKDVYIKHYDYSKNYIISCCERSLKLLQTDYVDVFLLHRPDPLLQPEEVAAAISLLKEQGKIRSFGVSNFTPFQTELLRQSMPINYNQIQFSASHFSPMLDGDLEYMAIHDIQPMAWSPMGTYFREHNRKIHSAVQKIAQTHGVPEHVILLAWILGHPTHPIPVIGTTNSDRISKLPMVQSTILTKQEWTEIWSASMGANVP